MSCKHCHSLEDITDLSRPYTVVTCEKCGREIKQRRPGKAGIGFTVNKGDKIVVPADFLTFSANPLKGNGTFSSEGLKWFAETLFGIDIAKREKGQNFSDALREIQEQNTALFTGADYLKDLDLNSPEGQQEMLQRMEKHPKSVEWFGYMAAGLNEMAIQAIEAGNASDAAWASTAAERFRALAVHKQNFEEVIFMGHSAKKLIDLLRIWDNNKDRSDEEFWQTTLAEHSYALSQLFSVQVAMIQGEAYVGGQTIAGQDARYLDFILTGGSGNDAILIEIKAPTTKLIGGKYRKSVYAPSRELAGAVVQIMDYYSTLRENIHAARKTVDLNAFNPRRLVIMGNYEVELSSDDKRRSSFEFFRSSLSGIDVVTFDELFKKVEALAKVFNLTRPNQ